MKDSSADRMTIIQAGSASDTRRNRERTRIEGQITGRYDWDGLCAGSVVFSTNGPQGGDAGYGGFLRVAFTNTASTWMAVSVNHASPMNVDTVEITCRGDAEIGAFIDSIEFLADKLRAVRALHREFQGHAAAAP
jgi:hypothetical protein